MQSAQEQYCSSKVFFCQCLCHINGPLYAEIPWNLTQTYLLLLCLMRGNLVVLASWCMLVEALQRAPLPRQMKHLLVRTWHLWEPWKCTGHALNGVVWRAQESEVRSHPGGKYVVWIWPKNVNFSLRNSSSTAIWASDMNDPPPPKSSGRWFSLVCCFTLLQVQNASLGKKRRFTILSP